MDGWTLQSESAGRPTLQRFFRVLQMFTKLLASLLASMWSSSVFSSPGPEASFEVKGPEGSTGLGDSNANISCPPLPHPLIMAMEKEPQRESPVEMRRNR